TIASKVTAATTGWVWKFEAAVGARFSPIKATMAPVTAGGMTASTTLRPAILTMNPMTIKHTPVTKMDPACAPIPYCSEAAKGAMKAKEDPRYDGSRLRVISKNKMVTTPVDSKIGRAHV